MRRADRRATARRAAARPAPRIRRSYFECRYGQLHIHHAIPSGGGFDEATTLLCFHQSPMSGRVFRRFLPIVGVDRSVYAPDTPGYGESDAPPAPPSIADYAGAMLDFLDTMRFRQVDLLGYHTGSAIAVEIAIARPELVRHLVLVAVPVLEEAERAAFRREPWPAPVAEDGSHLLREWQRSQHWRGPGVTLEQLAASFAEKLRNGPNAWWGANAVMHWPAAARLPLVRQPVLVLRPHDDLWAATVRARGLLPNAHFVDLPDLGFGLFEVAPERVAAAVAAHLAG
jgi:pimeloyl-ACP methyl ester carboxylesterase